MLVLNRREKQRIIIPSVDMTIAVARIYGPIVGIGIDAPPELIILREEVANIRPPSLSLIQMIESAKAGFSVLVDEIKSGADEGELLAILSQLEGLLSGVQLDSLLLDKPLANRKCRPALARTGMCPTY